MATVLLVVSPCGGRKRRHQGSLLPHLRGGRATHMARVIRKELYGHVEAPQGGIHKQLRRGNAVSWQQD